MAKARVHFLSCRDILPVYQAAGDSLMLRDDLPLVAALEANGIAVDTLDWETTDPTRLENLTIVRGTWNYQRKHNAFEAWMRAAQAANAPVLNAPEVILRNMSKHYLFDLERRGVPVVPTKAIEPHELGDLSDILESWACEEFVIKPEVGAGADHTHG